MTMPVLYGGVFAVASSYFAAVHFLSRNGSHFAASFAAYKPDISAVVFLMGQTRVANFCADGNCLWRTTMMSVSLCTGT